ISSQVDEFENDYPNINLKTEIQSTNIPEAMAKLLEQANQGNPPDVAAIDSYLFPQYIDYLEPLDDLIRAEGLEVDDFLSFAQDVVTGPDGKVYGLYMTTDTRVLFYNNELVTEQSHKWDVIIRTVIVIKEYVYDQLSDTVS